jgi:amino acid transporter
VQRSSLTANALSWFTVVALVVASNGPLTTLVSWVPLGISMGNGIGLPGSYVLVGLIYFVFAAGFTAMSRHVTNAGAFYAYVSRGLGRPLGTGAAFMAIFGYIACTLICYAALGFFASLELEDLFAVKIPWWACAVSASIVVHYFAYRNVEFNGRVLLWLMLAEILLIICFDITMAVDGLRHGSLTWAPLSPHQVFTAGFGPSLVFVVSSYMGFETTAIYSEEVRDPGRSIPKATYAAIAIITLLYAGSSLLLIESYGTQAVIQRATLDPGTLWLGMTGRLMGTAFSHLTQLLLFTSLLAALISFNNATVRYWFALGRDGILWGTLARIHPRQHSAYRAAWFQSAVIWISLLICAASHAHPLTTIAPCLGVIASIGISAVQVLTSVAVVFFFRREAHPVSVWRATLAPVISALALSYLIYQMAVHVELLVGFGGLGVELLPWSSPAVALLGVGLAYYLKFRRPEVYGQLASLLSERH